MNNLKQSLCSFQSFEIQSDCTIDAVNAVYAQTYWELSLSVTATQYECRQKHCLRTHICWHRSKQAELEHFRLRKKHKENMQAFLQKGKGGSGPSRPSTSSGTGSTANVKKAAPWVEK